MYVCMYVYTYICMCVMFYMYIYISLQIVMCHFNISIFYSRFKSLISYVIVNKIYNVHTHIMCFFILSRLIITLIVYNTVELSIHNMDSN